MELPDKNEINMLVLSNDISKFDQTATVRIVLANDISKFDQTATVRIVLANDISLKFDQTV